MRVGWSILLYRVDSYTFHEGFLAKSDFKTNVFKLHVIQLTPETEDATSGGPAYCRFSSTIYIKLPNKTLASLTAKTGKKVHFFLFVFVFHFNNLC